MKRKKLEIGTHVRITDKYSHYYGKIGIIEGDNETDCEVARIMGWPVPDFHYDYCVVFGDDIEHGYGEPDGLRVIRSKTR